jgi:hypothetical protein
MLGVVLSLRSPARRLPPQPTHLGRPLGFWLCTLATNAADYNAQLAVVAAGSNAVPSLVDALAFHRHYNRRLNMARDMAARIVQKRLPDQARLRFEGAAIAFALLGKVASNAVPEVTKMLDAPDPVASRAASVLKDIGGVPPLAAALTNGSESARYHALGGLANCFERSASALPLVLACLDGTNTSRVRTAALVTILQMPPEAVAARAGARDALTRMLVDPELINRQFATNMLDRLKTGVKP